MLDLHTEEPKKNDGLLTRYFRLSPALMYYPGALLDPEIPAAPKEDGQLGKPEDFRSDFEKAGIAFPPGASALFYREAQIAVVVNTEVNIAKIAEHLKPWRYSPEKLMRFTVRIVEHLAEARSLLEGAGSWAARRRKFGESVKLICEESTLGENGGSLMVVKQDPGQKPEQLEGKAAEQEWDAWPPKAGVRLTLMEVFPWLSPDDEKADIRFNFRHAAPQTDGQPAMRVQVSESIRITNAHSLVVNTFTIQQSKPTKKVRHYAVVATFEITDDKGRGPEEIREAIRGNNLKAQPR